MAKKVYIVIYENKDYEFDNWGDCKAFIEGKKNVIYRGFTAMEEAQDFIVKNIKKVLPFNLKDVAYAYVDGSVSKLNNGDKVYGYGLCVIKNGEVLYEDCGASADKETAESYQIGGELLGALKGVEHAISRGEERIIVVYDYMGIEMWANGTWQPKKKFVEEYVKQMQKYMNQINVDFIHVNSHIDNGTIESNNNNLADELAKKACREFIAKQKKY